MNKILPYIVIAILLGTVTMVVPYALLGPSYNTAMTEGNTLIQPSQAKPEQPSAPTEPPTSESTEPSTDTETPDNQERAFTKGGDVESSGTSSPVPEAPLKPEEPEETSEPETQEPQPEAPESALTETNLIAESLPILSPIGLMTVPSFLIALGAFIYLRRLRA